MTVFFNGISFVWVLAVLAVLSLVSGGRAWFSYRKLTQDAQADWAYQVAHNMQDLRLSEQSFVNVYRKVNAPRLPLYLAIGSALILGLTPIVLGLLNVLLWGLWRLNDSSRVFEPGYLVWEFFIFFGLIAFWALIGASVARRYHANGPGLMRDELIAARQDFQPTQPLIIGPNPAHILANSNLEAYKKMFVDALGLRHSQDKNWQGLGHICDMFTDGSDMQICVHNLSNDAAFDKATHPYLFAHTHAREDEDAIRFTIIRQMQNINTAFERIAGLGLELEKITGHKTSKMRSFSHKNIDAFLYEKL
ncbi:MAG: hypothetical protein JKX72_04775 [Robiginitomaculum sp.]|nr:hypothetical protein [Robiginitomaculum sp.]